MAILVTRESRIIVQGITGGAGSSNTQRMQDYGTQIVAGAHPAKTFSDIPRILNEQGV